MSAASTIDNAVPGGFLGTADAMFAQAIGTSFPVLFAVGVVVVVGGGAVFRYLKHRRKSEDLDRYLSREPRLRPTVIPCGLRPDQLAWWCQGLPKGDRRMGVRYAVQGPATVSLGGGEPRDLDIAAFQYWYEERQTRTTSGQNGMQTRRSYTERRIPAALVQLPVTLDQRIIIRPESTLGRIGLTRAGHQFESDEFNRRFRVEARNQALSLHLLDANFQQLMAESFPGRTIELFGELLLVAGEPDHRDEAFTGVIGHLPALREDALRVLRAIPPAFWRAMGVAGELPGGIDGQRQPADPLAGWDSAAPEHQRREDFGLGFFGGNTSGGSS